MKRFIESEDRRQATLLPDSLENYVTDDNPVRVIDVFVDELDLAAMGFAGDTPEANIADCSLALGDLALRRRFAFINLEPALNEAWRAGCTDRCGFDPAFVLMLEERINSVNADIARDRSLGSQYRVGHSYVTPPEGVTIADPSIWFRNIVRTEIFPLLEEYWFDAPDKAKDAAARLLVGIPE
jgi:hypothetical protein